MSFQHHSIRGEPSVIARFLQQQQGESAPREYPNGRLGAEDDGALAYAIAVDDSRRTIVIDFGKEVSWIGLDIEAAIQLRNSLTERIDYLDAKAIRERQLEARTKELQDMISNQNTK